VRVVRRLDDHDAAADGADELRRQAVDLVHLIAKIGRDLSLS
jgi:hypothetical protein